MGSCPCCSLRLVLMFAVKPVLTELRQCLEERHLVVSIAAGVTISSMQVRGPRLYVYDYSCLLPC